MGDEDKKARDERKSRFIDTPPVKGKNITLTKKKLIKPKNHSITAVNGKIIGSDRNSSQMESFGNSPSAAVSPASSSISKS